ncbi:MAG TPA: Ig-like domain-containing protein [Gemmatimonadales bacterium]|nr:Ig-like domain-containing protein [Gemmatimonadales bacterium]
MKPLRAALLVASAALAALAAACGSSGPSAPAGPAIQKAATGSGDGQTGPILTALPNSLRVFVSISGAPDTGVVVTWATAGTGASVSPTTSKTHATGLAATSWTLSQVAGPQTATASVSGATGSPVTFTATAAPGAATSLTLVSGDHQAAFVNSGLPNPLTVKVGDAFGNGVPGVGVTWQSTTATVTPTAPTTDASGIAQATVTLGGTPGTETITATSTGLTGSPVTFHDTATALPASASVNVGDIFFKSVRNSSQNPAVDTIAVGGTVTWTWVGSLSHSVQSTGTPSFPSSPIKTSGMYPNTFTTAGTYTYDCSVHGLAMTGTVVVK